MIYSTVYIIENYFLPEKRVKNVKLSDTNFVLSALDVTVT